MMSKEKLITLLTIVLLTAAWASPVFATPISFTYSDPLSGLSASADFSVSSGQLVIVITNTSTGVPLGFSNSDQLLTTIGFNLPDGVLIAGGTAIISPGSYSENFDNSPPLFGGADVSSEWGYGNKDGTGFDMDHKYIISSNESLALKFQPGNLDGPDVIDGPQAGLTNGIIPLGGLGAIRNSITTYLNLTGIDLNNPSDIESLLFAVASKGVIFEFGSDARFGPGGLVENPVPEPTTILMFLSGILLLAFRSLRTHIKA